MSRTDPAKLYPAEVIAPAVPGGSDAGASDAATEVTMLSATGKRRSSSAVTPAGIAVNPHLQGRDDPDHRMSELELEFQREAQASHMLFLWAVCLDKYRMAHMFWLRGDQSIINALVASRILHQLSHNRALSGPHLAEERGKMLKTSKKFENLAVGVLEECYNADSHKTAQMLHARNDMFSKKNAIKIAYDANSLAFLSHPATQSVINTDWHGQIKSVDSFWTVIIAFFLPFFLAFIDFHEDAVSFKCN